MIKPSRKCKVKQLDIGKKKCQEYHAQKRAKQRLGFDLPTELLPKITKSLKTHEYISNEYTLEWDSSQSKRLDVFLLKLNNWKNPVKLIYDSFRHTIVTFFILWYLISLYSLFFAICYLSVEFFDSFYFIFFSPVCCSYFHISYDWYLCVFPIFHDMFDVKEDLRVIIFVHFKL